MAAARTPTPGSRSSGRPRPAAGNARPARVRWDRLGRVAMLFVLVVLIYLYISPVRSLLGAFHQSAAEHAQVAALQRKATRLVAERAALKTPGMLELVARRQGLVKPGEKEFVVFGLPAN